VAVAERKPKLPPDTGKGRVFLIDAMAFIFRAYHAMARQRPMSTKTGIPTSATYVFVNMLNKLRKDFAPEYICAVFDVSATPFFLKGSGFAEGTLFPWVVSDFGLMDAIESGIVKVPRVPVSDDSMVGDLPRYRDLGSTSATRCRARA